MAGSRPRCFVVRPWRGRRARRGPRRQGAPAGGCALVALAGGGVAAVDRPTDRRAGRLGLAGGLAAPGPGPIGRGTTRGRADDGRSASSRQRDRSARHVRLRGLWRRAQRGRAQRRGQGRAPRGLRAGHRGAAFLQRLAVRDHASGPRMAAMPARLLRGPQRRAGRPRSGSQADRAHVDPASERLLGTRPRTLERPPSPARPGGDRAIPTMASPRRPAPARPASEARGRKAQNPAAAAPLVPSIARASSGVAIRSDSSSRMRRILETSAAFEGASSPRAR